MILLHSSDGSTLWIKSAAVTVVKPAAKHRDHLAGGTQAVLYTISGRTFAVLEDDETIVGAVDACDKGQP
jgi:uncharacterized RmlC-like cupin family protein